MKIASKMKRLLSVLTLLLFLSSAAFAQFNGCLPGFCKAPHSFSWTTLFSQVMTNDLTNQTGTNFRVFFFNSAFSPSSSGNYVRLTVNAGTSNGMTVDHAYCGKSTSPPNFDGDQVQVFSGGNASFTIAANGTLVLDVLAYHFVPVNQFMCSFYFSGATANTEYVFTSNNDTYFKVGADEASLTTVSGYAAISAGYAYIISKLEVSN